MVITLITTNKGLSPRVRGNQLPGELPSGWPRSIPARAGEPARATLSAVLIAVYPRACGGTPGRCSPAPGPVYPRACGGTHAHGQVARLYVGLSQRVRGNQPALLSERGRLRSIPARAGEPRTGRRTRGRIRVYPRACGGTPADAVLGADPQGLSPRVRGNPRRRERDVNVVWSIPARAEEPNHRR